MSSSKFLADVSYERMREYQRYLANVRLVEGQPSSSVYIKNILKHIKYNRELWRAVRK